MDSVWGLILIFLISHFLGDYYFQPKTLVDKKKESWKGVFWHFLIQLSLNTLISIPTYGLDVLHISIIISIAHIAIDSVKKICNEKVANNDFLIYLMDQFLHILSIVIICYCCTNEINLKFNQNITVFLNGFSAIISSSTEKDLATLIAEKILAIIILLKPIAVTVDLFLEKYKSEIKNSKVVNTAGSIEDNIHINIYVDYENVYSKIIDG